MAKITNAMYSKLPNLVLGFHGCSSSTYDSIRGVLPRERAYIRDLGL